MKPNIIVLATGHSGSSVVSEMISRLGWNILDSSSRFRADYKPMRNLNQRVLEGEKVPQEELLALLDRHQIPRRFGVGDPDDPAIAERERGHAGQPGLALARIVDEGTALGRQPGHPDR